MLVRLHLEIETSSSLIAEKVIQSVEIEIKSSNEVFERSNLKIWFLQRRVLIRV